MAISANCAPDEANVEPWRATCPPQWGGRASWRRPLSIIPSGRSGACPLPGQRQAARLRRRRQTLLDNLGSAPIGMCPEPWRHMDDLEAATADPGCSLSNASRVGTVDNSFQPRQQEVKDRLRIALGEHPSTAHLVCDCGSRSAATEYVDH